MGSAGSTAEPHTRRQPQQKSGGSSRDLKPQPGTKGGAEEVNGQIWGKSQGEEGGGKGREERKRGKRKKGGAGQKGEGEDVGVRAGCQAWTQVTGALSGPAESSPMKGPKKKKGSWEGRPIPFWRKGLGRSIVLPLLSMGAPGRGFRLSREEVLAP